MKKQMGMTERLSLYLIIIVLLMVNLYLLIQNSQQSIYIRSHFIYEMRDEGDRKKDPSKKQPTGEEIDLQDVEDIINELAETE